MHIATNLYLAEFAAPRAAPEALLGAMLPGLHERYRERADDVSYAQLGQIAAYGSGMELARQIEWHLGINPALLRKREQLTERLGRLGLDWTPAQVEATAERGLNMLLDGVVADWKDATLGLESFRARQLPDAVAPLDEAGHNDFKDYVEAYFHEKRWTKNRVGIQIAHHVRRQFIAEGDERLQYDFDIVPEIAMVFDDIRAETKSHVYRMLRPTTDAIVSGSVTSLI